MKKIRGENELGNARVFFRTNQFFCVNLPFNSYEVSTHYTIHTQPDTCCRVDTDHLGGNGEALDDAGAERTGLRLPAPAGGQCADGTPLAAHEALGGPVVGGGDSAAVGHGRDVFPAGRHDESACGRGGDAEDEDATLEVVSRDLAVDDYDGVLAVVARAEILDFVGRCLLEDRDVAVIARALQSHVCDDGLAKIDAGAVKRQAKRGRLNGGHEEKNR